MKKIAIAGASVALAALPVVSVFADTTSVTDTVKVTVDASCTLGVEAGATPATETLANGANKQDIVGSKFKISCNDDGGWTLKAVGASEGDSVTSMQGSVSGTSIPTGTDFTGATVSNWGFKATGTKVTEGYDEFKAIPGTATAIAESDDPTSTEGVDITYAVGISPTQASGTYTGKVTYTLVAPKEGAGA